MKEHGQLHVLHVLGQLGCGGVEMALARVLAAEPLSSMRHSVAVMRGEAIIADRFPPGVDFHCLHSKPNELLLPWRIADIIRRLDVDVVHARNWGTWGDCALCRVLPGAPRVPLIYSFHGTSDLHNPLRRRVAGRVFARLTTRLFTVSQGTRTAMARELWLSPGRIGVIPNGVDADRFCPADRPLEPHTLKIGTVGSLSAVKNQAMLVAACAELVAGGADVELLIAGEGPERPHLESLVAQLELGTQVRLLGHVRDVAAFLREIDIFVLPSHSEAHPNAMLEAMACALPCVATDVGGVREVLEDGRCGLIVPPRGQQALVEALERLIRQPMLRPAFGQAAKRRVREHYSLERMAVAYAAMYQEVANVAAPAGEDIAAGGRRGAA